MTVDDQGASGWTVTALDQIVEDELAARERLQAEFPDHIISALRLRADRQGHMAVMAETSVGPSRGLPELRLVIEGPESVTVPLGPGLPSGDAGNIDAVVTRN